MKSILNKLGIHDAESFLAFALQFIKFGAVGVSNTLINLGVYYILLHFGVHYLLANGIGYIIGFLNAFFWNRRFVFKNRESSQAKSMGKSFVSYAFTFVLSTALLALMVDVLSVSETIAPLINLCVTVPLNFLLNKFWAFR